MNYIDRPKLGGGGGGRPHSFQVAGASCSPLPPPPPQFPRPWLSAHKSTVVPYQQSSAEKYLPTGIYRRLKMNVGARDPHMYSGALYPKVPKVAALAEFLELVMYCSTNSNFLR